MSDWWRTAVDAGVTGAAKRLYLHNVMDFEADRTAAEAAWESDAELRDYWLTQARVALG